MKKLFGNVIFWIGLACMLILAGVVGLVAYRIYKERQPSTTYMDMGEYWGSSENWAGIVLNQEKRTEMAYIENEIYYLPLTLVQEINGKFYYDAETDTIRYMLPTSILTFSAEQSTYFAGETEKDLSYVYAKKLDGEWYIALQLVEDYTVMDAAEYADGHVSLWTDFSSEIQYVSVTQDGVIRYRGGIKTDIVADVTVGEKLQYLAKLKNWYYVMNEDGVIGYIQEKNVEEAESERKTGEALPYVYSNIQLEGPIYMIWHQLFDTGYADKLETLLANDGAVNVISPTWFSIENNQGDLVSIADAAYVEAAHELGLQVWALIDNFSDTLDSYALLVSSSARENLINQLLEAWKETGFDGINVDFEGITSETGQHYIQFIRELSVACRTNGIVLSVDNYVPTSYNTYYEREEQGEIVDYVVVMAYDEHYSGSEPGSTSSLSFFTEGLENTLKVVPAEKVIQGIPFYTRLWKFVATTDSVDDTEGLYEDPVYGAGYLSSEALSMGTARLFLDTYANTIVWLSEEGQYYGEYELDGATYRIWLEDASSIEAKLENISDSGISGIAAWKLGLETSDIWEVIAEKFAKK